MATSKKQLYTYENDYKEQHAKHVKRPALVTIKNPTLSDVFLLKSESTPLFLILACNL